ncbi:hypothetical protein LIER_28272 [Lithospermum erythrorhizon]|uniref:Retrotransposon gag domain-containing protein n=1 Tax=Lithospermum erythrorhizon TaxID=34254 RepID=A0AAV3RF54_LITER
MALCAKEKLGFKDGRLVEPETLNPLFDIWKRIDCMVSTWILNSISPGMKDQFMFTASAKKLWDEIALRYGTSNGPMFYQLEKDIASLSHGSKSVVLYFSKLKRLWDELNELEPPIVCICIEGCLVTQEFLKKEQRNKLMQFLMGLNETDGNSTLFVRAAVEPRRFVKKWDDKKGIIQYDHCGMKGHTTENCYKLKRYPIQKALEVGIKGLE